MNEVNVILDKRKNKRVRVHDKNHIKITFYAKDKLISGSVWDHSRFGLGVLLGPNELYLKKGLHISEIIIYSWNNRRTLGPGFITRTNKEIEGTFAGIILENEFLDMDELASFKKIHSQKDEIESIHVDLESSKNISRSFREFALNTAIVLSTFKLSMDKIDLKIKSETASIKNQIFNALANGIGKDFSNQLDNLLKELQSIGKNYNNDEIITNGKFLRNLLWSYIELNPFIYRTTTKPRGYSEDSTMMKMIYENDFRGDSSFGKIFYYHSINTQAAIAVRNRVELISAELENHRKSISGKEYRILSIACGPADEISKFLNANTRPISEIILFDQDELALAEAENTIELSGKRKKYNIRFVEDSMKRLLKVNNPTEIHGKFHFIYSMGLFDYMEEHIARLSLSALFNLLHEGGELIIGSFHKRNASKAYMEYFMDWFLIYRNEKELQELASSLTGNFKHSIEFDSTKSQMFLKIIKENH